MFNSRSKFFVSSLLFCLLLVPTLVADSGPPMPESESRLKNRSPEEMAIAYYNKGLGLKDDAWEYEKEAAEATSDKEKSKLLEKAQKAYTKAIKQYEMALKKNPDLYQAHSGLGYALRKTGDHQAALESYNKALELQPTYTEAIEYRAEAHLGLNMLEEAKEAYMVLFKHDRPRADKLLAAMKQWVVEKDKDPGTAGREAVQQFTEWVNERSEIAQQSGSKGSNGVW